MKRGEGGVKALELRAYGCGCSVMVLVWNGEEEGFFLRDSGISSGTTRTSRPHPMLMRMGPFWGRMKVARLECFVMKTRDEKGRRRSQGSGVKSVWLWM
mmetsp:Transcript_12381/g.50768  ORF Transcript_12381/g.50768 Transcript_12381/m.50768 type:complete len:99 (-) Transcript_12381:1-297(-)